MAFARMVIVAGAGICACWFNLSYAADQIIYKSTAPNGEVTYAWHPERGAIRVERIVVETLSLEQRRAAMHLRVEEQNAERQTVANTRLLEAQWRGVDREIGNAIAGVQQAEAALAEGREPRAGERLGKQGGGSRLTQAYFDRIHRLERAVEQARARLDHAYQARNALK